MTTAASPVLSSSDSRSYTPVLAAAGLAAFGAIWGVALAMGELDAMYICLSVIASLAILFDFRIGAVLLIMLMPVAESNFFPRSILGITGLNPTNILVVGTLISLLLRPKANGLAKVLPVKLWWFYVVPILIGGVLGMQHVGEIPDEMMDSGGLGFTDSLGYFRDFAIKPLMTVLAALMVGAALAKSKKPERFIIPVIVSVWIMALIAIGYVVVAGVGLDQLSGANSRAFLSGIGLHANDLGRLYAVAYALLLFIWWESKSKVLKMVLVPTMMVLGIALVLTFSRGAFLGFIIVNLLFLAWKFNAKTMALALLVGTIAVFLAPGAVYDRITMGFASGNADAVSAGRIDGIWLPLLPEVWKSPLWGNGLASTMWSDALRMGRMETVGHPHNAYLEALLDVGILGLGLFIAYFMGVWKGFRSLGSNAFLSPEMRGLYQGAAAGLVAFAVTNFAGSSFTPKPEYIFLWFAIGMMYGHLARRPTG
jgi:O-antigen ligase